MSCLRVYFTVLFFASFSVIGTACVGTASQSSFTLPDGLPSHKLCNPLKLENRVSNGHEACRTECFRLFSSVKNLKAALGNGAKSLQSIHKKYGDFEDGSCEKRSYGCIGNRYRCKCVSKNGKVKTAVESYRTDVQKAVASLQPKEITKKNPRICNACRSKCFKAPLWRQSRWKTVPTPPSPPDKWAQDRYPSGSYHHLLGMEKEPKKTPSPDHRGQRDRQDHSPSYRKKQSFEEKYQELMRLGLTHGWDSDRMRPGTGRAHGWDSDRMRPGTGRAHGWDSDRMRPGHTHGWDSDRMRPGRAHGWDADRMRPGRMHGGDHYRRRKKNHHHHSDDDDFRPHPSSAAFLGSRSDSSSSDREDGEAEPSEPPAEPSEPPAEPSGPPLDGLGDGTDPSACADLVASKINIACENAVDCCFGEGSCDAAVEACCCCCGEVCCSEAACDVCCNVTGEILKWICEALCFVCQAACNDC